MCELRAHISGRPGLDRRGWGVELVSATEWLQVGRAVGGFLGAQHVLREAAACRREAGAQAPGLQPVEATELAEARAAEAIAGRVGAPAAGRWGLQEAAIVFVAVTLLAGVQLDPASGWLVSGVGLIQDSPPL